MEIWKVWYFTYLPILSSGLWIILPSLNDLITRFEACKTHFYKLWYNWPSWQLNDLLTVDGAMLALLINDINLFKGDAIRLIMFVNYMYYVLLRMFKTIMERQCWTLTPLTALLLWNSRNLSDFRILFLFHLLITPTL